MCDCSLLDASRSYSIRDVIRRPGYPLPTDLREFFEARFGCCFGAVLNSTPNLEFENITDGCAVIQE